MKGKPPKVIGDLPRFIIRLDPPDDAADAVATAVEVIVKHPDGTVDAPVAAEEIADNVWLYQAVEPVDAAGEWFWRWNATAGLLDSDEIGVTIAPSAFPTPLP